MVQRAVVTFLCKVCGGGSPSRLAADEHAREAHGTAFEEAYRVQNGLAVDELPLRLRPVENLLEFRPCLTQTPWGRELR